MDNGPTTTMRHVYEQRTRLRSHVAVGDMATHNRQQNEQTTRDDDLARQQTCHIVQTVMTTSVVTVHIDPGAMSPTAMWQPNDDERTSVHHHCVFLTPR
ncbi:hypothetical protein K443DRAFT_13785 [Laccaria amethystina LaAM-08-1]|uniref:Uncharacterized protein n=1 Tax=Laccaria amethystina LaAM-08-1 TaxID=1095629 RepID=A0A0C9X6Z6_9AGAR|nr:hypothetical protein K443DRAFT_13785 [Laccaria amethystina LaAM-08-1]